MLDDIRNKAQSFGVKLIFGIIIVVFVFWGVGNLGGMSSDSLAVVNGEKISIRDFSKAWERVVKEERRVNPEIFQDEESVKQYKRLVLDELIRARLFLQEAERLGIVVTPYELRMVVDTYTEFQDAEGKFDPERYRQIVSAIGLTQGEFERDLTMDMVRSKLVRYVGMSAGLSDTETRLLYEFRLEKRLVDYVLFSAADYLDKAEVADEDVAAYYETNKEQFRLPVRASVEFLRLTPDTLAAAYPPDEADVVARYEEKRGEFVRPASFQARHILIVAPQEGQPGSEEAVAKAEAKLEQVLEGLKNGEEFADLAKQYSDDLYSADLGGMLGWIEQGSSGAPELEELAFSLEPGGVSEPLRLADGFHILKLEDKKEARDLTLDEVREGIAADLGRVKAEQDFQSVQQAAEDALAVGAPLADLGGKYAVKPQTMELASQDDVEKAIGVLADSRQILLDAIAAAAAGGTASTIPVPLNIERGVALVRINAARVSEIPPLEDVKETIVTTLKNEKGLALARAAADEALPSFTGTEAPEAFKDKVARSARPAVRISPAVEPLGPAAELVEGLFAATGDNWLPLAYEVPNGAVIARVAGIEPVTAEEWEQYGPTFVSRYRQYWSGQAVQSFLYALHTSAEVEVSLDTLDRLQVRN